MHRRQSLPVETVPMRGKRVGWGGISKEAIVTIRDIGFKTDSPSVPAPNQLAYAPISRRVPAHATREQIVARATAIWQAMGCVAGENIQNWCQAQAQLEFTRNRNDSSM